MGRKKIGDVLEELGLINREQLREALFVQEKTGEKIGKILVKLGYLSSDRLAYALAQQHGLEFVKLSFLTIPASVIKLVPYDLCKKYTLIPVTLDRNLLKVALADPLNLLALDNLRVFLEKDIKGIVADETEIKEAIEKYYSGKDASTSDAVTVQKPEIDSTGNEEVISALTAEGEEVGDDEAPVIRLVSRILIEAFRRRASDVHVEPLKEKLRIRYRIDGTLHEIAGPSKALQGSVLSRLKIMSKLDIAEKRLPQDGRIRLRLLGRDVDIRVSTLPAMYGESVVLRLLDRTHLKLDLRDIGFSEKEEKSFKELINIPNGIILVTGPTGSGKTTTLYTSLETINKPNRKIITVEDPVEYQLAGINQVQVKPSIGLTFASGLRSILRQAPNVIMIGEIRDLETANIAVEASLTGHLVFSTLHTNDAPGAITRMVDMGVKPYLVASAVKAILAQRLVKKICPSCKQQTHPRNEVLELLKIKKETIKNVTFYAGEGCNKCGGTGYFGRIAIFELLTMNDEISELVYKKVSSTIIAERARQCGMHTLREDGLAKAMRGVTTLDEILRVTQSDLG